MDFSSFFITIAIELHWNAKRKQGTFKNSGALTRAFGAGLVLYIVLWGGALLFLEVAKRKCSFSERPYSAVHARTEPPGCQLTLGDPTNTPTPRELAAPLVTLRTMGRKICTDGGHRGSRFCWAEPQSIATTLPENVVHCLLIFKSPQSPEGGLQDGRIEHQIR